MNNHSVHGLPGAGEVFIKQEFFRMKTLDFQSICYSVLLNQRLRCDVLLQIFKMQTEKERSENNFIFHNYLPISISPVKFVL